MRSPSLPAESARDVSAQFDLSEAACATRHIPRRDTHDASEGFCRGAHAQRALPGERGFISISIERGRRAARAPAGSLERSGAAAAAAGAKPARSAASAREKAPAVARTPPGTTAGRFPSAHGKDEAPSWRGRGDTLHNMILTPQRMQFQAV
jgi:hypothetical protein